MGFAFICLIIACCKHGYYYLLREHEILDVKILENSKSVFEFSRIVKLMLN